MAVIRVTKKYEFEMAHALHGYDGLCRNVHGHSYKLWVTVAGEPIVAANHPKKGMVLDFTDLKQLVKNEIVDRFDHALVVAREDASTCNNENPLFQRLHIFDFQPTCENLVVYFASRIKQVLPSELQLLCVRLSETESSYAEWYAADN